MPLAPCPRCDRHVDVRSVACPFCAAPTPSLTPKRGRPMENLTRAAMVYLGATFASAGCGPADETGEQEPPPASEPTTVAQPDGPPPRPEPDLEAARRAAEEAEARAQAEERERSASSVYGGPPNASQRAIEAREQRRAEERARRELEAPGGASSAYGGPPPGELEGL